SRMVAQDTVTIPLNVRAGFDISGPVMHLIGSDLVSYGAIASVDFNEQYSASMRLRYSSYSISEYNYDFQSSGVSVVVSGDYNFLKPKVSGGKYFTGMGFGYGLSFYSQEASRIEYTNPWGTGSDSFSPSSHTGHFIEVTPGVRTELFPGVALGWNLVVRMLISSGAGRDIKPVWMPGFGDATSRMSTGAEYYVSITIPYKKIRVVIKPKKELTEEDGEENPEITPSGSSFTTGGRL
ncbi:MAG: DUF6048 family protein, partial [Bacteroidales bacterium]|nr:DUF6048 family protein [Bacteroidales bacterium]